MTRWLRRIRGAVGMGLTWAVGWALVGLLIGVGSRLLPGLPWDAFFRIFDPPLPALAMPGFVGGALFSTVLASAGRRRRFDELSLPRFAAWGAVGGLMLSLVPGALVAVGLASVEGGALSLWQLTAVISGPLALLGAASAAGTLALARMAEDRALLEASEEVAHPAHPSPAPDLEQSTSHPPDPLGRILGLSGVLSVGFLVLATVLGGALRDDYSHLRHSISELYEVGAPNAALLMVLFTTYHALVIPFAVGLHRGLPGARRGWIGPSALGLAGLLGIPLGAYARCDPGCFGATTFRGKMHGVLVLLTVPLIFAGILAVWRRLAGHAKWRSYARYSLATVVVGVLFGVGMTPFMQGSYTGLLERVSVAIMVQWYAVMGLRLMREARPAPPVRHPSPRTGPAAA